MDDILKKNLIKELGLDKLPAEKQEEIFFRISTIVLSGVMIRVLPMLSEDEKRQLDEITDEPGDNNVGKVFAFLKESLPDFEDIVNQEIAQLKQDSFDVLSKIG